VVTAPEDVPPFPVDAVVAEEDTFMVMSAGCQLGNLNDHPVRIMTQAFAARPMVPGTVVIRPTCPLRFLAIVHDLDQIPTSREEWVVSALRTIFDEADKRRVRAIGVPILGSHHGSLNKPRFFSLLRPILGRTPFRHLQRVWLMVPPILTRKTREIPPSLRSTT
jgi:hypothetical protein